MELEILLEKRGPWFWGAIGLVLVIVISLIDYMTGYEVALSLFYLIPIGLVVWYGGRRWGEITAGLAAVALFLADFSGRLAYSNALVYVWNTILWVFFFFVMAWVTTTLRNSYNTNRTLARTDYVTGAISARFFYDLARIEIERSSRYKRHFTFAYIDMDNFTAINDSLGHSTGDHVLQAVTESVQRQIRSMDTLARLGGDEFALLLPETDSVEAMNVINRLHSNLVAEMHDNGWPVTFSVGAVTYTLPPKSVDDMVKQGDQAMYSIKSSTKNGVAYRLYAG